MNIWGIKKKIKEIRYNLKKAIKDGDKWKARQCEGSIRSLKSKIEKIRKERQNGK